MFTDFAFLKFNSKSLLKNYCKQNAFKVLTLQTINQLRGRTRLAVKYTKYNYTNYVLQNKLFMPAQCFTYFMKYCAGIWYETPSFFISFRPFRTGRPGTLYRAAETKRRGCILNTFYGSAEGPLVC